MYITRKRITLLCLGKPQKRDKVLLLMAGQLRPNLPPLAEWPLESWNVGKKGSKKSFFSLLARPFTPPRVNGPAIKTRTFFCGFPYNV